METYSANFNNTTTELPFIHCPPLPDLIQWRNDYLTTSAIYNSIATMIVNALSSFVTVISNGLLVIAILANRNLRTNRFTMILLSLSMTDFLVGCFCQPLFIICRVAEMMDHLYMLCNTVRLQTSIGIICLGVSVAHSCLISFERYLAVRFPTRYKEILTNGRVLATVAGIWLCATIYVVLPYIGFQTAGMLIGRSVVVALFVTVTAIFYIAVFFEFKRTSSCCNFINQIRFRLNRVAPGLPINQAAKVNQDLNNVSKAEINSSNISSYQHPNEHLQSSSYRCKSGQIPRMTDMPKFSKKDNTLNVNRNYPIELSAASVSTTNKTLKSDQFPHDGGKLRQISSDVQNVSQSQCHDYNGKTNKQKSQISSSLRKTKERKLGKTMLITVMILLLCLLPSILAYSLLPTNQSDMENNWLILNWIHTLAFLNSCINPFWFCWRMENVRKGVLKLVKRN